MAVGTDRRIVYTEEMVGKSHPTKADTLNGWEGVDLAVDARHDYLTLHPQSDGEETDADQIQLFNKAQELWFKPASDGTAKKILDASGNIVGAVATPGDKEGCHVEHGSTSTVTVTTGHFEAGDALIEITSPFTYTPVNPAADTWYGLAFIPGAYAGTVSAACFEPVNTASFAYSNTKHGWYCTGDGKTDNRVLGLYLTDASEDIIEHRVIDGWWRVIPEDAPLEFVNTSTPPQTFTAVSTGLPALSIRYAVEVQGYAYKAGSAPQLSLANGDDTTASGGTRDFTAGFVPNSAAGSVGYAFGVRTTNTSGQLKYYCLSAGMTAKLAVRAFALPRGM